MSVWGMRTTARRTCERKKLVNVEGKLKRRDTSVGGRRRRRGGGLSVCAAKEDGRNRNNGGGGGGGGRPLDVLEDLSRAVDKASTWFAETAESMRFENWAPRSSRAWRLREYKSESDASQYRSRAGGDAADGAAAEDVVSMLERSLREVNSAKLGLECVDYGEEETCALGNGFDDEDEDVDGDLMETIDDRYKQQLLSAPPLTGQELADMCYAKYGKFHDMCVKNQCISKGNTRRWVALNVYIGHLGQRSFPMTTEEYVQKLDSVAQICTGLRQSAYVRQFFAEPPIPRRGLPSRPRADTAVSLRLNRSPTWNDDIAEEFFES